MIYYGIDHHRNSLAHFGVKGMKWGVRKKKDYWIDDVVRTKSKTKMTTSELKKANRARIKRAERRGNVAAAAVLGGHYVYRYLAPELKKRSLKEFLSPGGSPAKVNALYGASVAAKILAVGVPVAAITYGYTKNKQDNETMKERNRNSSYYVRIRSTSNFYK